ncbi:phosphatidate cytidylyltransferase [Pseudahrensia aquimaris]|uniref:Phosphatidate cytidylyltransferase n=1 Tax=Pseudahrensia aquimaris TaxID=744461 RepID=A0ABW3FKZ6_9HYPH
MKPTSVETPSGKPPRRKLREHSELTQRIVSALVLVGIALPLIWLGGIATWIMAAALFALCLYEWRLMTAGAGASIAALGLAYCGLTFTLPIIRDALLPDGLFLLILLFLAVIASDVFAYFSGRAIGGPKLMPSVSPNKTISGALGGLVGAVVVASVYAAIVPQVTVMTAAVGAAVLAVFSQAGDLFESGMKRRFNVKDSSQLIPGHGGFLDRVDGLLGASIPMLVYVVLTT